MDHKTLGEIFQEINDDFSDMNPGNLDHLEDRVLSAMYKLGSCLMESKISDWNTQLRHKICPECVTKLIQKPEIKEYP